MWSNQCSDPPRPDRDTSKLPIGELLTLTNLLNRFHFHLSHVTSPAPLSFQTDILLTHPWLTPWCNNFVYIFITQQGDSIWKRRQGKSREKESGGGKKAEYIGKRNWVRGQGLMTHFVCVEACWHEVKPGTGTARERGEEWVQPATHRKTVTHTRHPHSWRERQTPVNLDKHRV